MTQNIKIEISITRKTLISGLVIFLIALLAYSVNSETLTFTTYYPAPYGGYVTLLTTGKTLLARNSGFLGVGLGTTEPSAKVDIAGDVRIRTADAASSLFYVNRNGSVMTGTEVPKSPAPNGSNSNVETNDLYQRSLGAWLSDAQKVQVHLGYAKYHTIGGFGGMNNYWGKKLNSDTVTFACPVIGGVKGIIIAAGGVAQDTNIWGAAQGQYLGVPIDYNADRESMYLHPPIKGIGGPKIYYWYVCVPKLGNVSVLDHR